MSKSLGIWLGSIDERSMVRSLHTQDNTKVEKMWIYTHAQVELKNWTQCFRSWRWSTL